MIFRLSFLVWTNYTLLSLLRHFLRDLTKHLSDPDKLSSFIVHFINLWIGLNCDILRGGQGKTFVFFKKKVQ